MVRNVPFSLHGWPTAELLFIAGYPTINAIMQGWRVATAVSVKMRGVCGECQNQGQKSQD
jgi:hypothetical protein